MRLPVSLFVILAGSLLVLAACGNGDDDPTATAIPDTGDEVATATLPPEADEETPTVADEASPTVEPTETEEVDTTPTAEITATTEATAEATTEAGADIPDTPVGNQLAWMLATLNGEEELTEDVYAERFTPAFISQVSYADFVATNEFLAQTYGTFTFTGFAEPPTETQAVATVTSITGDELLLAMLISESEPYQIDFSQIVPASAVDTSPADLSGWEDLDAQLSELAAQVSFQAVELGEDLQPVHALNADQRLGVASAFKLYILGELARQVEAGDLTWEDELAIREEWKSLPTGVMQDEPEGATFSLRHYAELMISISDNTATDHLLFHLGREQVEAMQAEMGHGEPGVNVPMLATHELFALKIANDPELVERYVNASDEEQRQMLEEEIAQLPLSIEDAMTWTEPRFLDTIEWFASSEDLVQAMASLRTMAEQPGREPVLDILAINPGIEMDQQSWNYVGFKGGSELGVFNLTWLLERADGRWFVMTVTLNDDSQLIDENAVIRLVGGAAALLAETE